MAISFTKTTFKNNQAPAINATFLNNLQDNIKTNLTGLDTRISTLEDNENTIQNIYSLMEKKIEGAVWIDGKPIYRKVIKKFNIENASRCDLYTDTNIETLIKSEGFINYNNGAGWHKIGGYANSNFYSFLQFNNEKTLTLWSTSSYDNSDCYIILEYTKSTD